MIRYALSRIGQSLLVLVLAFTVVFWAVSVLPSDPATIFVAKGDGYFNPEVVEQVKQFYGYDKPLLEQYFGQLVQVASGNFGFSLSSGQSTLDRISGVIGETFKLATTATIFAISISIGLVLFATTGRSERVRKVLLNIPPLFSSVPTFWLGLVILQIFSVQLGLFSLFPDGSVASFVIPALVLAVPLSAPIAQVLLKNAEDTMRLPHVATARAKGGTPGWVVRKHVLKNAAGPALTVTATTLGALLGGSVVTETVVLALRARFRAHGCCCYTRYFAAPGAGAVDHGGDRRDQPGRRPDLSAARSPSDQGAKQRIQHSTGQVQMSIVTTEPNGAEPANSVGRAHLRGRRRRVSLPLLLSAALLIVVLIWTFAPGLFTSFDPLTGNHIEKFQPPSWEHWFGTDHLGRDVLARVIYGTSQTVLTAGLAVAVGLIVGSIIGVVTGVSGPVVDAVGMRISDVLLSLPGFLVSIWIVTAYGSGRLSVGIGVGVGSIAVFARVFRTEVLRVRALDYVEAAFLSGANRWSVIAKHILPNTAGSVIALAVIDLSAAILAIAALGYLGYSAPPPTPEWGLLVAEGRNYIATAWWLTTLPGIVILVVIIALGVVSRRLLAANRI